MTPMYFYVNVDSHIFSGYVMTGSKNARCCRSGDLTQDTPKYRYVVLYQYTEHK